MHGNHEDVIICMFIYQVMIGYKKLAYHYPKGSLKKLTKLANHGKVRSVARFILKDLSMKKQVIIEVGKVIKMNSSSFAPTNLILFSSKHLKQHSNSLHGNQCGRKWQRPPHFFYLFFRVVSPSKPKLRD